MCEIYIVFSTYFTLCMYCICVFPSTGVPAVIHFNGGGKRHHLDMEGKSWYKNSKFNTPADRLKIAEYLLSVPTATATGGKLAFKDLCGDYLRK